MSLSSWTANAALRRGQRNKERDLHFEQAIGENKGDCFPHITFEQLQVTALLLEEEDLTTIITRTPFSLALLMTAAKSFMCVQNFRFNIAIFVLFFFIFITVNLEFLPRHIFTSHCQIFILIVHSSSFRCPSFLLSLSTLQGRAPSRSGLPLKKKKKITNSPDAFTHFLRLFAFHVDGQLRFTGTVLDGNILIITINCRCSTLSSIISDSFESLLAAPTHKFHKS